MVINMERAKGLACRLRLTYEKAQLRSVVLLQMPSRTIECSKRERKKKPVVVMELESRQVPEHVEDDPFFFLLFHCSTWRC